MSALSDEYTKKFSSEKKALFNKRFSDDYDPNMSERSNIIRILGEMRELNLAEGGRIGFNQGSIPKSGLLKNFIDVATGSGAHERATREYLNPFKGGEIYDTSYLQKNNPEVVDYMSGYLKDYVDPTNQAGDKFNDSGVMSVTGLGKSPNPFTKEGLAIAANLSSDPSFQAENLFGEGTLKKTDSGYDYTGGKFDFNFDPNSFLGKVEKNIFQPSEYKLSFDKNFNPITSENADEVDDMKALMAKEAQFKKQKQQEENFQKIKEAQLAKDAKNSGANNNIITPPNNKTGNDRDNFNRNVNKAATANQEAQENAAGYFADGGRIGLKDGLGSFTTNDPTEAFKEIINRIINKNVEGTTLPISDNISLNLGPKIDEVELGGILEVLGGELSFGGGLKGDDKGIGFSFKKEFNKGGLARMLGE